MKINLHFPNHQVLIVTGGTAGNTEKLVIGEDSWKNFEDYNTEDISCTTVENQVICSQGLFRRSECLMIFG